MSKSKAIAFALVLALTVGLLPVTSFADEAGAVPDTTVTEEANDVSPQEEANPEKSSEENSSEQEEKKEENSETESKQEETNDADSVKESDQTSSEQGQKADPEETASTEDSNDKETSDMDAGDSSETNVSQPKESETVQTVPRTEANNKLDLSDLNSGIAAAEALVEKEYTVKSWAALQEALSAAKDLAARAENDPEKVTQEEINSAAKALKDAVDALVKAGDIFVNMNVPFADFYGDDSIDAVSTATSKGKLNSFLKAGTVYGSYTEGDGTIRGIVVPVKMTADQFDELTGKVSGNDEDFFISAPLTEEPAVYLELKDTSPSFSSIKGKETKEGTLTAEKVEYHTKRRDIQIKLTEKIMPASDVYGAYMTMTDGSVYPLLQIASIYKADSMYEYGWSLGEMIEEVKDGTKVMDLTQMYVSTFGKTIDTVTYITKDGLETYGLTYNNEKITIGEKPSYVLMNIPYDEFYANENGAVDGISSATLKGKARNVNVNGASYHQSEEAVTSEGIKGAMYPVRVDSMADLEALGGKKITDDDKVTYTMNVRGKDTEFTLEGKDALQEAPSYSYYVLPEAPSHYKTLTVADGKASFSAASGKAATGGEITGDVTMGARHADVEIKLSGLDVTPSDVSAVVMTAGEDNYALHHVVNIWRGTEIGWNTSDIDLPVGTKITNVRYYLKVGTITDYPADITIGEMPSYVLMNIPYDEFYANENGAVDGISSATLKGKARNINVNGASYHQSEEAVTSEGIKGAMYPVRVNSLADLEALGGKQVTDDDEVSYILSARGTQTEVSLKGRDALQEAPSYSYYVLSEAPSHYKTLTVADGKASFSAASGKAATGGEITGDVTMGARHADVEIKLSGLDVTPSDVSAVVMTAGEDNYALHHVVNIWRGTEIGWNTSDIDLPVGTKITNVRYYLKDGTITDYPANIELKVEITAEAEDGNTVKINGLPSNIVDAKATVTSVDGENTVTFAEAAGISDGKTALTKELEDGREYTVVVSSSNYPDLTAVFTYKVDKTALQEQIKTPETLTKSDYTEESWKAVEDALKEARAADEKEHATQSEIDKAEKALKDAIDALVKKTDESGESKTSDSNTEDSSNSKTDQSSAGKSGVTEEDGKTAETAAVDYKIIEGANSTWTKGSSKGLLIVSNAPFDKFDSVIVDNKEIASASYKAEEGSTEITLLPEYLEKLTIGKHSFTIQSTDGSASTNFTIAKKAGSGSSNSSSKSSGSKGSSAKGSGSRSSAKTSDDNMGRILLYAALVIVSISVIAWLYSKRKKKV